MPKLAALQFGKIRVLTTRRIYIYSFKINGKGKVTTWYVQREIFP
jgi:hypothetical protein